MNQMHSFFGRGGGTTQNRSGFRLPGPLGNAMDVIRKFRQFMQNPMQAFLGAGMNIPENIQGNPQAITNYLRNSGQMSDDQYNQVAEMANIAQDLFGRRS